ncbi:MAG: hypothetical protein MJA31_03975, partial [Clostridia bacterium]|nr:hypothetical protein [Clostridia bacterium]
NRMSLQLDTLKLDTISTIEGKTYDANQLVHEIQELSDQIYKLSTKDLSANDLMDRRGLMIEKLSAIVNVNVDYDEFSRVKITEADTGSNRVLLGFNTQEPVTNEMSTIRGVTDLGAGVQEITVVRGGDISKTYTFTVSGKGLSDGDIVYADPAEWEAYDAGGTPPPPDPVLTKAHLREGELAGNKAAIEKIDEYHTELDQLAFTIAESVNLVHGGGANNIDFFTTSDGGATINAANIQVNTNILDDVNLINKGVDGTSGDGDASRAWAVAQLREVSLQLDHSNFETYLTARYDAGTMEVTPDPSGTSFQGYYKDVILKIGIDSKQAEDGVESQTTLLLQLGERRESISGVSIDEEVANLVQFQNSYQANARVITTLTEMLDTLINRMGL